VPRELIVLQHFFDCNGGSNEAAGVDYFTWRRNDVANFRLSPTARASETDQGANNDGQGRSPWTTPASQPSLKVSGPSAGPTQTSALSIDAGDVDAAARYAHDFVDQIPDLIFANGTRVLAEVESETQACR
jgi:hypothetical protein